MTNEPTIPTRLHEAISFSLILKLLSVKRERHNRYKEIKVSLKRVM